jgi:type I restriction enzyme S subunit
MSELPKGWLLQDVDGVTLPVSKIDQKLNATNEIHYIDIACIDNIQNKVVNANLYKLGEAPSRARQIIKTGDVLFSTVRPYLRNIAYIPSMYNGEIASTGFSVLRPASGIEPMYLYYFAISQTFVNALIAMQYGVSYPAVKNEHVKAQSFPLAPEEEQKRIVAKIEELFSELDKGVESLKTAQKQLKVYRQSILKHAFEGKLTAKWREENADKLETADVLLKKVEHERSTSENRTKKIKPFTRDELESLPEVPSCWKWIRLGNLTNLIAGKAFQKAEYAKNGTRLFQIANVSFGKVIWDKIAYLPDSYLDKHPDLQLRSGNLVMALNRPLLGDNLKIGILKEEDAPSILYQRVGKFLLYNLSNTHWIFNFLRSPNFITALKNDLRGVNIPFINQTKLLEYPIPVCPLLEQQEILAELESKFSVLGQLEKDIEINLKRSEILRQSILKKAFLGELVAQDPSDEPASVLLEKIKAEKASKAPIKKTRKKAS